VDVVLADDAVEIVVEDKSFLDETKTFVIVGEIFAPSRIIKWGKFFPRRKQVCS